MIKMAISPVVSELKKNLPEGVSAEDVDRQVDEFLQGFKDEKIDQAEIQSIVNTVTTIMADNMIDQEEAKKFLDDMKKAIEN